MAQKQTVTYDDRDSQDQSITEAVSDIISAEQQARAILARAEEGVKATQLDTAAREKALREQAIRDSAAEREKLVSEAVAKAEREREQRVKQAQAEGEQLVTKKQKQINALINKLFVSLGGKA